MPSWKPIKLVKPHRIMVVGSGMPRFFEATPQERKEIFQPRFGQMLGEWEELGARVVSSFCDDVFRVGPADEPFWAWYLIYEVDDIEVAAQMIQAARQEVDGVEIQEWVKLDIRIGRPFFAREEVDREPQVILYRGDDPATS